MSFLPLSMSQPEKPVRVLLADHDPSSLALYSLGLSRLGFEVATAVNGLDCVSQLRKFGPDVLILEPELLWGDGASVLARMREDEDVPSVPVIVLYTRSSPQTRGYLTAPPVKESFPKPVTVRLLAERIGRVLQLATSA